MKCIECGNEISVNSKFCKYCGAPVRKLAVRKENNENALKNPPVKEIIKQKKPQNKIAGAIWNTVVSLLAGLLLIISGLNFISVIKDIYRNNSTVYGVIRGEHGDTELVSVKVPEEEPEAEQEEALGEEFVMEAEQADVSRKASGEELPETAVSADEAVSPDRVISSQADAGSDIDMTQNPLETTQTDESGLPEYMLVDSDCRYVSEAELDNLTKEQLKIARNELYARHGRKFEDEGLTTYFSQFEWYHPMIEPEDFEESMLNVYEIANRDLIVRYEREHGYRS